MSVRRSILLAALALMLNGAPVMAQADVQTGLVGRVVMTLRCPVPLGDDLTACPALPLQTLVTVHSADGSTEVAHVTTDADGQFAIALDPGAYTVDAADVLALPVVVADDQPTPLIINIPSRPRHFP